MRTSLVAQPSAKINSEQTRKFPSTSCALLSNDSSPAVERNSKDNVAIMKSNRKQCGMAFIGKQVPPGLLRLNSE